MSDILEQIAEHNRMIYLERKLDVSLSKMMDMAYAASGTGFAFEKKLAEDGMSFICGRWHELYLRVQEGVAFQGHHRS